MSVIEKLREESMALRKSRSPLSPSIQFALSEITRVGKNDGNRETTEAEAIKVIQKIVANLESNKSMADEASAKRFQAEIDVLSAVLPKMASDEEVRSYLEVTFGGYVENKGVAMKSVKSNFGALVDMKRAGEIITEMYGV
jgi:uncharacterized protein